ncbi:YncE family protein [Actinomadura sp. KC345]|uniref:YncE family protein n=1 Tax=Actinomadura sp. KC345 TaxID=2530371 RepID=UPI00104FD707|nr:YncE family protein [Actinomadura sp. KC345]TDC45523.1 YncE family protein [Actinomadura sp. KC345]
MGRQGGRSGAATLPLAAATVLTCGVLAGCESPVPFYRPGEGAPDGPVVGLGGPAPYVSARPSGDASEPPGGEVPLAPAGGHVYSATGPGMIAPNARGFPARLYVANGRTIDVIDPDTLRVVGRLRTGAAASGVVPSWDLRRLWATDRGQGTLVPVGPRGGGRGRPVKVGGGTGLYFAPDGGSALVLARRPRRVDVHDPETMRRRASVPLPCAARHADFTPDGASMVATCASDGTLARVDLAGHRVSGTLRLPEGARPGDLRLSPDGALFYVADSAKGGVWLVDAARFAVLGFVRTAPGARGLAISRDARRLFVVGAGTLTAVAFGTRRVTSRWPLPGGGSPAPGGVSSDGTALWLADPRGLVYAVSTRTGRVVRKVRIGGRPAGLCVHPQPGRYSLGGTGLYR